MNYIVLDMEWNQPWPGSPSAKKVLPVQIRGEIIQIGAVRITGDQQVGDEFQVLIKPKFYRRLNRRVSKLTGIKEAQLRDEGIPMAEAMAKFRAWCGEDVIFLTWGFDDITILRENLRLYGIDESWVNRWYNAQMIFNAQTDGSSSQKLNKVILFVTAIAIHNLPEGIAAGVGFGSGNNAEALTVAGGIALQNIPEGMVIVGPMLAAGMKPGRTFIIAAATGIVEVLGTLLGYFAVTVSTAILPFALAFAGGTMLYVISDEMIPETHAHGSERGATYALLVGFCLMLVFDVLLG